MSISGRMLRLLGEASPSVNAVGYTDFDTPREPLSDYPVKSFSEAWRSLELPTPPPNDSDTSRGELALIRGYLSPGGEYERRQADIHRQDRAEKDPLDTSVPGTVEQEFWNAIGPAPIELKRKVAGLVNELIAIGTHFKRQFNRVRPYQLAQLEGKSLGVPPAETANSPAYPSNHALIGAFLGRYLGAKYPKKAAELERLGREIGDNRVYAGFHFPSDNEAGRKLADALFPLLKEQP